MLHMAIGKNKKNMCVVTRVAILFRAAYHHVKVNRENKNTLRRNTTENTLQEYKQLLR